MFVIFFSGHMESRCLATAMFIKKSMASSRASLVSRCRERGNILCCHLTSTGKHMKYWRCAVDKVKTWTFLNKESEPMHLPPSQTSCLITIGAVQHAWKKVSEEHKF